MSDLSDLAGASDAFIEEAIARADPMVLRGVLYQLTGDETLRHMDVSSSVFADTAIHDVESVADITVLRARAAQFMKDRRDRADTLAEPGPRDRLVHSLALTAGFEIPDDEREIWVQQGAFDPFGRGIHWADGVPPAAQDFTVAVIGTGLSGLHAGVHLKRAGIPFFILEKNDEVGGTWYENRYPGARVDTASRGYSHQFGLEYPFPDAYCPRDAQLAYFKWVADRFALREHITFRTEVKRLEWDEAARMWDITTAGPDGTRTCRANAVFSCVGFLSRPSLPDIPGLDSFAGLACHSAEWPAGMSVDGRRVAIIGSAASGYQTLPVIARTASHAFLFQRTPSWCFDDAEYLKTVPEGILWLERNMPLFANFERFRLCALRNPDTNRASTRADPNFQDEHARSPANKWVRDDRIAYIRRVLASRPDLIDKMIPPTPPLSSRPIRVAPDDNVYTALLRDNVTLVTDGIERITPRGIMAGGQEIAVDIIIHATGFKANDFLWPMEIRGKGGARIEELWAKDGPRAYLGAMVPGFPNLFMSYGPNSNNFGGFQVVDLLELVLQFALRAVAGLIEQGQRSVEVTEEGYWKFAAELDREEELMLYRDPRARNYYQNAHGRSAVNGPIDIRRMWRWLNQPARPAGPADVIEPWFGGDLRVG